MEKELKIKEGFSGDDAYVFFYDLVRYVLKSPERWRERLDVRRPFRQGTSTRVGRHVRRLLYARHLLAVLVLEFQPEKPRVFFFDVHQTLLYLK